MFAGRSLFSTATATAASVRRFSSAVSKKNVGQLGPADVKGKVVFVRSDFNVPMSKETGAISDDTRIRAGLPTIQALRSNGAKVVLCTHMGRPKGPETHAQFTLAPVSARLSELLGVPVTQASECVGPQVTALVDEMKEGSVLVLENVRFEGGETKNDAALSKHLAECTRAEVYVNDAFGTAHRAHSSTAGVTEFIHGPCVAGLLLKKELDFLYGAVDSPKRPFAAIVGGAKVSTKISVLDSLINKCDKLVIGGGMMFTFLRANGIDTGASMVEEESLGLALDLQAKAKDKGVELFLPEDVVVAEEFAANSAFKTVPVTEIPDGWMGLDVGPVFSSRVETALEDCETVLWNGPMGVFEWENFAAGTLGIANKLADLSDQGKTTIVGGGDSVAAIQQMGLGPRISHISTGGGASLELLEGKVLPGVAALDDA